VPSLFFASAEAKTSLFLAGAHRAPVAALTNKRNNSYRPILSPGEIATAFDLSF
jgi:hypothetical protein